MSETIHVVQEQGPEWSPSERIWLAVFEIEQYVHGLSGAHAPSERLTFRHTDTYGLDHETIFCYIPNLMQRPVEYLPGISRGINGKLETYQLIENDEVLYWGVDDLEPSAGGEEAASGMLAELNNFFEMIGRYPQCFSIRA